MSCKSCDALRERAEALESQVRHSVNQAAFDIQRERAEHLQSEVEAYRADVSLTITQRDAAEERAERAEAKIIEADRVWERGMRKETKRADSAEADVKRLQVKRFWEQVLIAALLSKLRKHGPHVGWPVQKWSVWLSTKAIAAPECKGDIITMTSDTVCVRLDCENFGKPLAGCQKPEERKP